MADSPTGDFSSGATDFSQMICREENHIVWDRKKWQSLQRTISQCENFTSCFNSKGALTLAVPLVPSHGYDVFELPSAQLIFAKACRALN